MFEKEIKFIDDFNRGRIQNLGSYITFKELTKAGLHPAVMKYIAAEIDFLIYNDRKKLLKDSIFDYSSNEVHGLFSKMGELIKRDKKFSTDYIIELSTMASSFNLNFLTQPNETLAKFVFEDNDELSVNEVKYSLNYIYYYDYFFTILMSYFKRKRILTISFDEFDDLIKKIHKNTFQKNGSSVISNMLVSLADFFNIGSVNKSVAPVTAVQIFLHDSGLTKLEKRINDYRKNEDKVKLKIDEIVRILFSDSPVEAVKIETVKIEDVEEKTEPKKENIIENLEEEIVEEKEDSSESEPVEPEIETKQEEQEKIEDQGPIEPEKETVEEEDIEIPVTFEFKTQKGEIFNTDELEKDNNEPDETEEIQSETEDTPEKLTDIEEEVSVQKEEPVDIEFELSGNKESKRNEEKENDAADASESDDKKQQEKKDKFKAIFDLKEEIFGKISDEVAGFPGNNSKNGEDSEESNKDEDVIFLSHNEVEKKDETFDDKEFSPDEFDEILNGAQKNWPEFEEYSKSDKGLADDSANVAKEDEPKEITEETEPEKNEETFNDIESSSEDEEDESSEAKPEFEEDSDNDEEIIDDSTDTGENDEETKSGEIEKSNGIIKKPKTKKVRYISKMEASRKIEVSDLLRHRKMKKIIAVIFDHDMSDFTKAVESIDKCKNVGEALHLLESIFEKHNVKPGKKEAEIFKEIITNYYYTK